MSRTFRHRAALAGLAVTIGVTGVGFSLGASAKTSFGADRLERAEGFVVALEGFVEAARSCDLNAARVAYRSADAQLNSFEVEVAFASNDRWLEFDRIYWSEQVPSSLGISDEDAGDYTCEERVDLAEEAAGVWGSIVEYLDGLPEDSPAWNELHQLRAANQGLRLADMALEGFEDVPATPSNDPDPVAAAAHWAEFASDYQAVRGLIRNDELAAELDGLVAAAQAAFDADPATAGDALGAVSSRFGLAINLVDRAARNHKYNRSTWDPDAWEILDTSADEILTIFEIRDLVTTNTPEAAAQVVVEYNDWLQYGLSRKMASVTGAADAALTTAVNNYAAAQTPETQRALRDQLLIAEQVLAGQFWGTPELDQFYAENENPAAVPAFAATLSPDANTPPGPAGATGSADIEIDAAAGQVCQVVNYGNTGGPLTLAHIHSGAAGVNGPVVVDLLVLPSGQRACVNADPAVLGQIVANPAGFYVNLHTDAFPSGVLRGQLSPAA